MYCRCSYGNRYQLHQNKVAIMLMIIGINYINDDDNVNDNRYQLHQNKVTNFWTFVYIHIDI